MNITIIMVTSPTSDMPSALARLRLLLAFFRIPFAGAGASNTGRFRGLWALADSLEESPYLQH